MTNSSMVEIWSALAQPPTSAISLWPAAMRARATRIASTPADSSPMKVREEPVTPCTMEMLPATRFESCARNNVGRRSFISRSLRKAAGRSVLRIPDRIMASTAASRSPPPAATIMSMPASSLALPLTPALSSASPAA